jgi:hypothetical protein
VGGGYLVPASLAKRLRGMAVPVDSLAKFGTHSMSLSRSLVSQFSTSADAAGWRVRAACAPRIGAWAGFLHLSLITE